MKKILIIIVIIVGALLVGIVVMIFITSDMNYESHWLDSPENIDIVLTDSSFLVSTRFSDSDIIDYDKPVIICAHGFSASSFEWMEFYRYAEEMDSVYISLVVLGGHGTSLMDFKNSEWEDWGIPIMKEYEVLCEMGFTNISIAGSSTGGALMIEALTAGKFKNLPQPNNMFLIDPYIIPSNGIIYMIDVIGMVIKNSPNPTLNEERKAYWYYNRPAETLIELKELILLVQERLEPGFEIISNMNLIVYKAKDDGTAGVAGAYLIKDKVFYENGEKPIINIYDSDKHVLTRGALREEWSELDKELQMNIFNDMILKAQL